MISEAYKSRAVQAVLGPEKSGLFPDTLWLGFLNTSGNELPGDRVSVPNDDTLWEATTDGMTTTVDIDGGLAPATWIVGRIGLFDAETEGDLVVTATLVSPVTVQEGQELTVPAGDLTFRIA